MTSLRSWLRAGVLFGTLVWHAPAVHADDGGASVGFGPVFAFSTSGSWSCGWELGAGVGVPLLKVSIGGSYSLDSKQTIDPRMLHYIAFEPWLLVGGTIGGAFTEEGQPRVMYGLWEGVPITLDGEQFGGDNSDDIHPRATLFTLAIGWRGFGSTQQFYLTPKIWSFATLELNS